MLCWYCDNEKIIENKLKDALSYSGGVGEPAYITKCFDLKQGTPCSAAQFAIAEFSTEEYQYKVAIGIANGIDKMKNTIS